MHHSDLFKIVVLITASCTLVHAQQKDIRTLDEKLSGFDLGSLKKTKSDDKVAIRGQINIDQHVLAFVYYALPPVSVKNAFYSFLKPINAARVDQQVGSSSAGNGSSSTVAKAGLTSLASAALESGSLTQTIDQNVATLHVNGDGLYRFLSNQQVIPICAASDESCQTSWGKNLDLSASFNVSSSGTKTLSGQTATSNMPVDLSALISNHQFSSATVQYALFNKRDFRSKEYHDSFTKWFKANASALNAAGSLLTAAVSNLLNPIEQKAGSTPGSTHYSEWIAGTGTSPGAIDVVAAALTKNPSTVEQALADELDKLIEDMRDTDPQFDTKLQSLSEAYTQYFSTEDNLGRNMITAPQFLVQGIYSEPMLEPKLITAKLSYAMSPGSKDLSLCGNGPSANPPNPANSSVSCANPGTLTFNAGVDIYQSPQPTGLSQNTSRFRDAQAGLQFDRPLGPATSPAQLSVGAYYQYQRNPGIFMVPAGATTVPNTNIILPPAGSAVLTNTKGSLFAVQAVISVQIPGAGLKLPIGISWSNRTDLVRGNQVSAHIGFTFNSDGPLLSTK
jgi:hypothetical protein